MKSFFATAAIAAVAFAADVTTDAAVDVTTDAAAEVTTDAVKEEDRSEERRNRIDPEFERELERAFEDLEEAL